MKKLNMYKILKEVIDTRLRIWIYLSGKVLGMCGAFGSVSAL